MRRAVARVTILVLLAASLVAVTPTDAAESLQMAVRPGFGGAAKLGTWVPVEVELSNAGPELSGEVQIVVEGQTNRGAFNRPPVTYSTPVTLPNRSRKRVSLDVYLPTIDDKVQAQFVANGQTLAQQPVAYDRVGATELSCGVWAGNPTALDFLTTLDLGGPQRRIRLASLDPGDVPGAPHLLQSLDCLILANVSTASLSDRQKDAIRYWVSAGGLLVVGGGSGAQKTASGLPPGLLPVKVSGSVPARSLSRLADYAGHPLPERGPWLVGDAAPTDGATVVDQDGIPLLVAGRRGLGAVVYLGLDPTAEPLRSWEGAEALWRHLLAYAPVPQPGANNLARQPTNWGRLPRLAISDLTGSSRTSTAWLTYLMLGYAACVGPANYLLLRRLGRLEWSIVTIPVVTLLAAGAALSGARANPASDLIVNDLAIVRSWDGESALVHSYVGVFSLREQAPDLQLPPGSLVQPLYYPFPAESAGTGSQSKPPDWSLNVRQGDQPNVARLALRPGALGTFGVDQLYHLPGKVTGDLVVGEASVHGTVVSRLARPLRNAGLVVGGDVVRLGDLRPGESRPVSADLRAATVDFASVVKQLYPTDAENPPREEAAQRDLLQAVFGTSAAGTGVVGGSFGLGQRVDLGPATLVGWLDDAPLGEPAASGRIKPLQRTLFVGSLPVRPQDGAVMQVPPALMARRLVTATGQLRPPGTSFTLNSGESIAWEYQLPFDARQFAVDELRIDLAGATEAVGGNGPLPNFGAAHLYDWQLAEWVPVELDFGENHVAEPQRFVSSLGTVRLRYAFRAPTLSPLSRTARSSVTFGRFDLSARGAAR